MTQSHTYKKIEIVGTSTTSVTHAIQSGIKKTATSVRNMSWFEVSEIRGAIDGDEAVEIQVSMKIGLRVED